MKHNALSQSPHIEVRALSKITPQEARTRLSLMQAHIPAPQEFNPDRTWEDSCHIDMLFDKVRAVLSYRAKKEVAR